MKKFDFWLALALIFFTPFAMAQWTYAKVPDEMRNSVSMRARLTSQNAHQFDFPHQGGSKLSIIVWKHPDKPDVYDNFEVGLFLNRGQFSCSSVDGCVIRLRVDNDEIESYDAEPSEDSRMIFITDNHTTRFMNALAAGKRLIVEVGVFRHGDKQYRFAIPPLRWPK